MLGAWTYIYIYVYQKIHDLIHGLFPVFSSALPLKASQLTDIYIYIAHRWLTLCIYIYMHVFRFMAGSLERGVGTDVRGK